jgi:catechol 2,3-dioxygenase-like lactoylglutathione lyase family enzyme
MGGVTGEGLPGLRGTEHIGITVPNLEEAVEFFTDVLGCEVFYELGPYIADDDWMLRHLNVPPRTVMRRLKFLRCKNGANFEVIEYEVEGQHRIGPRNCDVGGHHVALYVDDISSAISCLKGKGVRVLGEPTVRAHGPNAGQTWIYFLAPWGMQFELVSFPDGKGYEKTSDRRLWHPANPAS